jgi:hypothetical protein
LEKNFVVMNVSSVTLKANRGLMRILSSRTFNRFMALLMGDRFQRFMEANDYGWTLMALAKKRPTQ